MFAKELRGRIRRLKEEESRRLEEEEKVMFEKEATEGEENKRSKEKRRCSVTGK